MPTPHTTDTDNATATMMPTQDIAKPAGIPSASPCTTLPMPIVLPTTRHRNTGIIIMKYDSVGSEAYLVPRFIEEGRKRGIAFDVIGCCDCVLSDANSDNRHCDAETPDPRNDDMPDDAAFMPCSTSTHRRPPIRQRHVSRQRAGMPGASCHQDVTQRQHPAIPLHHGVPVPECDVAIVRRDSGHITSALTARSLHSYNTLDAYRRWHDKWEQVTKLSFTDCLMPRHVLCSGWTPYEDIVQAIGLPFVAKTLRGMRGNGVSLVMDEDGYRKLADGIGADELLCEEYISESAGRDLRVFIVRGDVVACMERDSANGDFRANLAQGGTAKAHGIDDAIRTTARQAYQQTGLDIIGLDMLFGKDGYVFCETNVTPGLRGIECATDVNVVGHIIGMIAGDLATRP